MTRFRILLPHYFLVFVEVITDEIGNLKKMESLNLQHNRITKLPVSLNKLSALRDVSLAYNFISSFPIQLVGLKHLNSIDLSHNKLSALPNEIKDVEAIEINLNQNQVNAIPLIVSFLCHQLYRMKQRFFY